MKNYQQTPRQRRTAKAERAKTKHKMATRNPVKQFEQLSNYSYYKSWSIQNLISFFGGRL